MKLMMDFDGSCFVQIRNLDINLILIRNCSNFLLVQIFAKSFSRYLTSAFWRFFTNFARPEKEKTKKNFLTTLY